MKFENWIFLFYITFSLIIKDTTQIDNLSPGQYPYVKKINNNKYVGLDQKGVYLIGENFQTIEKVIVSLSFSSYNARSANIVQFDNIIIVINSINLYIFSIDGSNLSKKESVTFINHENFYSIIPYNKENNNYIFYLMYFDAKSEKKLKYSKGTYESSNIVLTNPTELSLNNINTNYFNIDCILMEYNAKKIISCFYGTNSYYIVTSFDPENNFQKINNKSIEFSVDEATERYVFKTRVLPGNQRAIFCTYSKNDIFDCAWYDISTNSFYNYTKTGINGTRFYAYNIYIEYFEETPEILIGKPTNQNTLSTIKCSKELECSYPVQQTLSGISQFLSRVNIILLSNKYYVITTDQASSTPTKYKFELNMELGLTCKNYYNIDKTSCLSYIPDGYYCNDQNAKTIAECDSKCSKCNKESSDLNQCISCNNKNEFYVKYNEMINQYKTCYSKDSKFEGLYLNLINNDFEPCFPKCKKCSELGTEDNNLCEECISGYHFNSEVSTKNNCYEECQFYYYIDNSNNYQCSKKEKCPPSYKLISSKKKCVQNCNEDSIYTCEYQDECLQICPGKETYQEETIKNSEFFTNSNDISTDIDINLDNFLILFRNGSFNDMIEHIFTEREELTFKDGDIIFQLTSSEIQNNNIPTKNNSVIKLGACEDKLKENYGINPNDSLLIFKADIPKAGLLSSAVEYEVYHPVTREILNMSYCQGITIEVHLSASINPKEIYKYNSESDYYNDICFSSDNKNGIDITINDRREEFIYNNLSICEPTCKLMGYINETQEAICECNIKKQLSMISELYFNKKQFFKDLTKIKSLFNFKVMKCYKYIFSKKSISEINFGNYICIPIIFLFLLFSFIFFIKGFSKLKLQILALFNKLEKIDKIESKPKEKNEKNFLKRISADSKGKNIKKKLNKNNSQKKALKNSDLENKKKIQFIQSSVRSESKLMQLNSNKTPKSSKFQNNLTIKDNQKLEIKEYTDSEINSFSYDEALQKDKRTFIQYYFSLLRTKHEIIFTFYPNIDYNSIYIKISLLLFIICLYYTINTSFYNDKAIHQIYENKGIFDFIYRLPRIIYSTLITSFIKIFIRLLSLSENDIIKIKKKKTIINRKSTKSKFFHFLKCKFVFFYIIGLLFLLIFWVYLTTFCFVYKNTQYYVIKDASISFCLSLIYPIFYNILPGIFRIPSLKSKNRKYLYIVSKLLQLF